MESGSSLATPFTEFWEDLLTELQLLVGWERCWRLRRAEGELCEFVGKHGFPEQSEVESVKQTKINAQPRDIKEELLKVFHSVFWPELSLDNSLDPTVLVLGSTQAGKSTLINSFLSFAGVKGPGLLVGEGNFSATSAPTIVEVGEFSLPPFIPLPNTHEELMNEDWTKPEELNKLPKTPSQGFKLIDAPGINDGKDRDAENMMTLCHAIHQAQSLSCVILVIDSNSAVDYPFQENLKYYLRFLAPFRLPLYIVHTKWDALVKSPEEAETRRETIKQFVPEHSGAHENRNHFFVNLCGWENNFLQRPFKEQYEAMRSNSLHELYQSISKSPRYSTKGFPIAKPALFTGVDNELLSVLKLEPVDKQREHKRGEATVEAETKYRHFTAEEWVGLLCSFLERKSLPLLHYGFLLPHYKAYTENKEQDSRKPEHFGRTALISITNYHPPGSSATTHQEDSYVSDPVRDLSETMDGPSLETITLQGPVVVHLATKAFNREVTDVALPWCLLLHSASEDTYILELNMETPAERPRIYPRIGRLNSSGVETYKRRLLQCIGLFPGNLAIKDLSKAFTGKQRQLTPFLTFGENCQQWIQDLIPYFEEKGMLSSLTPLPLSTKLTLPAPPGDKKVENTLFYLKMGSNYYLNLTEDGKAIWGKQSERTPYFRKVFLVGDANAAFQLQIQSPQAQNQFLSTDLGLSVFASSNENASCVFVRDTRTNRLYHTLSCSETSAVCIRQPDPSRQIFSALGWDVAVVEEPIDNSGVKLPDSPASWERDNYDDAEAKMRGVELFWMRLIENEEYFTAKMNTPNGRQTLQDELWKLYQIPHDPQSFGKVLSLINEQPDDLRSKLIELYQSIPLPKEAKDGDFVAPTVLVLGMTQSGKTTLVNSIRKYSGDDGPDLLMGDGNHPATTEASIISVNDFVVPDYINLPESLDEFLTEDWKRPPQRRKGEIISGLRLIDAPGLGDSEGRDPRHILELACAIRDAGSLSSVILVFDSQQSLGGSLREGLDYYLRFLDSLHLPLFVVHTKWDTLAKSAEKERRVKDVTVMLNKTAGKEVECIHFFIDLCGWEGNLLRHAFAEYFEALKSNALHQLCKHLTARRSCFTHEFMIEKPSLFRRCDRELLENLRYIRKLAKDTLFEMSEMEEHYRSQIDACVDDCYVAKNEYDRLNKELMRLGTDEIIDFYTDEPSLKEETIFYHAPGATSYKLVDIPHGFNLEDITVTQDGVKAKIVRTDPTAACKWGSAHFKDALIASGPSSNFYRTQIEELKETIKILSGQIEDLEQLSQELASSLLVLCSDVDEIHARREIMTRSQPFLSKPKLSITEYAKLLPRYERYEEAKGYFRDYPEKFVESIVEGTQPSSSLPPVVVAPENPMEGAALSASQSYEIFDEVTVKGRFFGGPVTVCLAVNPLGKQEVLEFLSSVEEEDTTVQFYLGRMCENVKREQEATKWFTKSAEGGNAKAQFHLGWMYQNGEGVPMDKQEAVKWYVKSAEGGNAAAQFLLGRLYETGEVVSMDEQEAVKWYMKSAEGGNAKAQSHLGWMYEEGEGVEMDKHKSKKWYNLAAEGEEMDKQEPTKWPTAEGGNAEAQYKIGKMYEKGDGVPMDKQEAVKWYMKSAEGGCAEAQFYLGLMYEKGEGVEMDKQEAVKWYMISADGGKKRAQFNLGLMRLKEEGVSRHFQLQHWRLLLKSERDPNNIYTLGLDATGEGSEIVSCFGRLTEKGKGDYKSDVMVGDVGFFPYNVSLERLYNIGTRKHPFSDGCLTDEGFGDKCQDWVSEIISLLEKAGMQRSTTGLLPMKTHRGIRALTGGSKKRKKSLDLWVGRPLNSQPSELLCFWRRLIADKNDFEIQMNSLNGRQRLQTELWRLYQPSHNVSVPNLGGVLTLISKQPADLRNRLLELYWSLPLPREQQDFGSNVPAVVVLGQTQSGKTTLVNSIRKYSGYDGPELIVGDGNRSATTKTTVVSAGSFFIPSYINLPDNLEEFLTEDWKRPQKTWESSSWFKLIDAPGLSDSEGRDHRHILGLARAIRDAGSFSGVILVINSGQPLAASLKEGLSYYLRFLDCLKLPLFIVHTKWDTLIKSVEEKEQRQEYVQQALNEIAGKEVECIHFFIDLCGWEDNVMKRPFTEHYEALKSNSLYALCKHIAARSTYFTHEFMIEKPNLFKTVDSELKEIIKNIPKQMEGIYNEIYACDLKRYESIEEYNLLYKELLRLNTKNIVDFKTVEPTSIETEIYHPPATSYKFVDIPCRFTFELRKRGKKVKIVWTDPKDFDTWDSMYFKDAVIATTRSLTLYETRIKELNEKIENLSGQLQHLEKAHEGYVDELTGPDLDIEKALVHSKCTGWLSSFVSRPKLSIPEYTIFLPRYEDYETTKEVFRENPEKFATSVFMRIHQTSPLPGAVMNPENPITTVLIASRFFYVFNEARIKGRFLEGPVTVCFAGADKKVSSTSLDWCLLLKSERDPDNIYILELDASGEETQFVPRLGILNERGKNLYKGGALRVIGVCPNPISLELLLAFISKLGDMASYDSKHWVREIITHLQDVGMSYDSQKVCDDPEHQPFVVDYEAPIEPRTKFFYLKIGNKHYLNLDEEGRAYWGEKKENTPYFRKVQVKNEEKTEGLFFLQIMGPVFQSKFLTSGFMNFRLVVTSEKEVPSFAFVREPNDARLYCFYFWLDRSPVCQRFGTHSLYSSDLNGGNEVAVQEEPWNSP